MEIEKKHCSFPLENIFFLLFHKIEFFVDLYRLDFDSFVFVVFRRGD